ncbi:MAG: Rpn family recombination-promoting nuclease/putative transposase [Holosporales bacterium]|jgi:predicted transposase/invertase (TIGR01784 family)|nr:Rpn family recombination-promoting nuclease/putative transposase [Holosporales bacterium]
MERFLNPRNDWMFKQIFGTDKNRDILIDFLNAVFAGVYDPIEEVNFLPVHQDPEIAAYRQTIVDVRCTDAKKRQFIVEMQCYADPYFIRRACVYACRAYIGQVAKPEVKSKSKRKRLLEQGGDESQNIINNSALMYKNVHPVILLAVVNKSDLIDTTECVSHHKTLNVETLKNDIKEISYSFVELSKFNKRFDELKTARDRWCFFFKYAESTEADELAYINKHYPLVGKAYSALKFGNYSVEEYDAYCRHEMNADAHESTILGAKEEGREEGRAEGRAEGLIEGLAAGLAEGKAEGLAEGEANKAKETAIAMLAEGLPIEVVSRCTGLSIKEVKSLKSRANL